MELTSANLTIYYYNASTSENKILEPSMAVTTLGQLKAALSTMGVFNSGLTYGIMDADNANMNPITVKGDDFERRSQEPLPATSRIAVSANPSKSNHGGLPSTRAELYAFVKANGLTEHPLLNGVNYTRATTQVLQQIKDSYFNAHSAIASSLTPEQSEEVAEEVAIPVQKAKEKEEKELTLGEMLDAYLQAKLKSMILSLIPSQEKADVSGLATKAEVLALKADLKAFNDKLGMLQARMISKQ